MVQNELYFAIWAVVEHALSCTCIKCKYEEATMASGNFHSDNKRKQHAAVHGHDEGLLWLDLPNCPFQSRWREKNKNILEGFREFCWEKPHIVATKTVKKPFKIVVVETNYAKSFEIFGTFF